MRVNTVTNKDIALIDLVGNLTGYYALELQDYLNRCLDQTICFQLIDFKQTFHIDSLGIRAIIAYIRRGGHVRLFNVEPQIRWRFEMETDPNEIEIYNEIDTRMALTHFTKEISDKEIKIKEALKYRRHVRISTNFEAVCHFNTEHNLNFTNSKLIDLSEGGFLIDNISLLRNKKGVLITSSEFYHNNLSKISFQLGNTNDCIIADCRSARVIKGLDRLCIGGEFERLSLDNRNKIKNFVHRKLL